MDGAIFTFFVYLSPFPKFLVAFGVEQNKIKLKILR